MSQTDFSETANSAPEASKPVPISLVPTFGSSCSIAATTFTNFGKPWARANILILVPLCRSEVPGRIRRLRGRDFRSAVPGVKILKSGFLQCAKADAISRHLVGAWLSPVEHCVRDAGVAGSNPAAPTILPSAYNDYNFCAQRNPPCKSCGPELARVNPLDFSGVRLPFPHGYQGTPPARPRTPAPQI